MIGKPKFKLGDKVSFILNGKELYGKVYVVDKHGVFEDDTDVHYDIMVSGIEEYKTDKNPEGECLYKHVKGTFVNKVKK